MYFSKEFLTGVGFVCVGVAGMYFFSSKYFNPSTDDCCLQNIKENLEDDQDDKFFDAETGSDRLRIEFNLAGRYMNEENIHQNHFQPVEEELYKNKEEIQLFRELQHNFEEYKLNSFKQKSDMLDVIQTLKFRANEQELKIKNLKLGMEGVKTDLNTLIKSTNVSRTQMTSTEKNTENPSTIANRCKLRGLKTRISVLEREVMKNSSQIVGMDYAFRELLLTRTNSGMGAAATVAGENRFDLNPSNTHCHQLTTPTSSELTLAWTPPVHSVPRPPPPPASVTPSFGLSPPPPPPPPPPPMMTTGTPAFQRDLGEKRGSPNEAVPGKIASKTYSRILITEDLLKSVVLKPPGQRMAGKRILTR